MADRRRSERRVSLNTPDEKISRIRDRRLGERRESPRAQMTFLVRDLGDERGEWAEREGELSVGGIHWLARNKPEGPRVEVRFRLPGVSTEVRAEGEIIRVTEDGGGSRLQVRFTELDVAHELAIARH